MINCWQLLIYYFFIFSLQSAHDNTTPKTEKSRALTKSISSHSSVTTDASLHQIPVCFFPLSFFLHRKQGGFKLVISCCLWGVYTRGEKGIVQFYGLRFVCFYFCLRRDEASETVLVLSCHLKSISYTHEKMFRGYKFYCIRLMFSNSLCKHSYVIYLYFKQANCFQFFLSK